MVNIELTPEDAAMLESFLTKQIEKTQWVIDNKNPTNKKDLENKVSVMASIKEKLQQEKAE